MQAYLLGLRSLFLVVRLEPPPPLVVVVVVAAAAVVVPLPAVSALMAIVELRSLEAIFPP